MTMGLILSNWSPVLAWAGLIFYMSSIPSLNSGWGFWDTVLRKCAHVGEYAVLTALLVRAFRNSWPTRPKRFAFQFSSALALVYAMSDEFHQSFVPGRGPSVLDVLIDAIGISLVVWALSKL